MKTILITGASSGIGLATAQAFLKAGWQVGCLARRADALSANFGGDDNAMILPADVTDGFLSVSILDVSGNVFHLLPNLNRQDNAVADLRDGRTGPVKVRVAFDLKESAQNGGLAFRVDDSTLGKSKVIVLHSSKPLFDGMRPTSESASGYAEALQKFAQSNDASILSLDSKILVTAKP